LFLNWKSHSRSEFRFGKGTNVITGIVGSGKTSTMDAICFALYGTFPALNNRRVSLEEVIMGKPNRKDSAVVVLEFGYSEKEYRVERVILRKGQNQAKLFEDGRLIAGTKTRDVTRKIEEILEVNFELFSRAIYSEQNNIDYFLRLSPAQRKEKMDDLLQLNRYEKARANAVLVGNRLRRDAEERRKILAEQKAAIGREDIGGLKKRRGEKEGEVKRLEAGLPAGERLIKERKEGLAELEKGEKEYRLLSECMIKLVEREKGLERNIREFGAGPDLKEIGGQKGKLQKELRELKEKTESLLKNEDGETKKINSIVQKIKLNEARIGETSEVLERLKEAGANCPICKSELGDERRTELIAEDSEDVKRILVENEKLGAERKSAETMAEKIYGELENCRRLTDELKGKLMKIESAAESAVRAEKQRAELTSVISEKKKLDLQIKNIKFDGEKLRKAREGVMEARSAADSARERLKSAKEVIAEIRAGIVRIENMEKNLAEMEEEIVHLEKMSQAMGIFTSSLRAVQAELRNELINTVNAAMEDIWARVYPYMDYSGAKIEASEEDYEIIVRERSGNWVRAEGILSGGERSSVAITMRVAISLILTRNLGWLILDEPTHNLDINSVRAVAEMMREHLPEIVEQIFIITHDKHLENAASSNLYLLERDKNTDGVTRTNAIEI